MREAITDPIELLTLLGLTELQSQLSQEPARHFTMRVPRSYVARMRVGDPFDPLLRQVLPLHLENIETPGYRFDAVGDLAAIRSEGLLHKYQGRALLISTGHCAIHCRYCFRRHFPYSQELAARDQWHAALMHLRVHDDIDEVILSGGDPWSLSTRKLTELTDGLRQIPHIKRLRIHTRQPIVLPERIDRELLEWLQDLPWPVVIVVHANHENELTQDVPAALNALRANGHTLLNQSVLLRGVNDSVEILRELSVRLFDCGVLPYYLHQLDRVHGAAHFEVDDPIAQQLMDRLRCELPGYLVPRLVKEIAGANSKTPL